MYKYCFLFAASLCGLLACQSPGSKKVDDAYVLKGTIKGLKDGTVKLSAYNDDDRTSTVLDSTVLKDGGFEFRGKTAAPQMVTVTAEPGNWSFRIFLENQPLEVTADTTGAMHYDYTMYGESKGASITKFTESGSSNYDAWMAYQQDTAQKQFDGQLEELGNKIQAEKDKDQEYRYRDQADSLRKLANNIRLSTVSRYINANPGSAAGAYMLRDLYNWYSEMPLADMQTLVAKFTGEAKQSPYYSSLEGIVAKRRAVSPGSVAPDFTLLKRDSSTFTLSSLRGKYVMIDFWASWCHPCRQAIPHWKQVYAKYKDKGFDILSVSDDSQWKAWFKAMDQEKMPWTQVCDEFPVKNMPARVGSLYLTHFIPFYVLLDKEGKILVSSGDEKKIDEKLAEIFGS
ncbi:TlpA disulfide reductase family protein [Flavihumibacter petaseus]|uniref:Putative thiol-disulfide oxidoreductase n=1 Tax=Flavihumibacter petaseus NBRC 106054 TaxID=1220578 RepID=A0A0E9MZ53_9BACT|nr:TlpA disulfide reductase family protein [Flavihumibacter petaseus]GAO43017.1 putative thiol-disulfide oxidoreductase [Flavihumibacter petaseus NBRC 106054]